MPSTKKITKALGGSQDADVFLDNLSGDVSKKYDSLKNTAPPGLIRKTKIGDVLKNRYYGDDFDTVVNAAQSAAEEGRPSHYMSSNMPKDAMDDEIVMLRPKDDDYMPWELGAGFASPNAGIAVSPQGVRERMSTSGSMEDLLRGVESHEIGHSIDIRDANDVEQSYNALMEMQGWDDGTPGIAARQDVKDDLASRLGEEGAGRVMYAADYPELKANIAHHKRNLYAQNGLDKLPMTREDVTRMYDGMAENAASHDIKEMGLSDEEIWVLDDLTPYDRYGNDPDAHYGPMTGRQLRGAAETDMNLGNIWLHADEDEKAMMVEDFLRSVDNFDIRKSLLARTA